MVKGLASRVTATVMSTAQGTQTVMEAAMVTATDSVMEGAMATASMEQEAEREQGR